MVETHWDDLRGRTVRYRDATWELTGDVDVRANGELLGLAARDADDDRRREVTLVFAIDHLEDSLNPGEMGDQFDRLERVGSTQYLVIKTAGQSYRYELRRLADA